ncbi:hypothetical protein ACSV4D_16895 [Flavobacterium sp. ARAG 55.4]|uniref:hypothetical protein n=1 Tax=Flavobacterium sp. ARAG 55.4 TaxID=3451357 RepID=UPI003F48B638
MKSNREYIENLQKNGYPLTFETVFNLAFENYKKIVIYAGSLFLVGTALFTILAIIILHYTYGLANFQELIQKPENLDPKNFSDEFITAYIISMTLLGCMMHPLFAGFIKMAHCAQKDEEFHVSTIFGYYKWNYFKELFLVTLIISISNTGISFIMEAAGIPALGMLASVSISVLTVLTVPLIIFSDYSAIESIRTSINLTLKQPLLLLGLLIMAYLFCITGFFIFFIGLFFTLPFLYSMYYAIYSSIIGFNR